MPDNFPNYNNNNNNLHIQEDLMNIQRDLSTHGHKAKVLKGMDKKYNNTGH